MNKLIRSKKEKDDLFNMYASILSLVKDCGAHRSIVAGGAIRDIIHDKPIKDIDIFYTGELDKELVKKKFPLSFKEPADELEGLLGGNVNDFPYANAEQGWNVTFPCLELEGCEYPIQLIKVEGETFNDLALHVNTFGCQISKLYAYLSKEVESGLMVCAAPEYWKGINENQLIFSKGCAENYKLKIMQKFNDWTVDVPKKYRFLNRQEECQP